MNHNLHNCLCYLTIPEVVLLTRAQGVTQAMRSGVVHTLGSGKAIHHKTPIHLLKKIIPLQLLPNATHA